VYDGKEYKLCRTLKDLVKVLCSKRFRNWVFYAHNGGKFDALFIVQELVRLNKNFRMITQGARIVEIKVMSGKNVTSIRDSYCLLPMKQATLAKAFKVTEKMEGAIDFEKETVSADNPLHVEYNRADCVGLYEIIEAYKSMPFVRDTGPKLTRSSTALAAWRTTLSAPIRITEPYVQNFCRRSYAGGRVEIFRAMQSGGASFDINSLYPSMMLKPLPGEFICETNDAQDFGFHEVTVHVPETYMPILWSKTPKLIFPTGYIRGVYFSEELALAERQGAKIIRHHRGMRFTRRDDLFREFVNTCYALRIKHGGESAIGIVAKDCMNHCYGKTAEKELKKSFSRVDPKDPSTWPDKFNIWRDEKTFQKWGFINVERFKRAPHMLCHIASAVTAWGRIHMAENFYLPFQDHIYYTDTDCSRQGKEMPSSLDLGAPKREFGIAEAFYLLPKCYFIRTTEGKIIRRIKGFSSKSLESFSLDNFKRKELKYEHKSFLSLRESLIRNNEFLSMGAKPKEIHATYDKRKMLPDGNTIPWRLNKNGEIENG
jgi:hypothetical protein